MIFQIIEKKTVRVKRYFTFCNIFQMHFKAFALFYALFMIFIEFTAFFFIDSDYSLFFKNSNFPKEKFDFHRLFLYFRVFWQFMTFVTQEIYVVTFLKYYVKFLIFERILPCKQCFCASHKDRFSLFSEDLPGLRERLRGLLRSPAPHRYRGKRPVFLPPP